MSVGLFIAVAVAATLAALLQGLTGFGYGLLLTAVLMAGRDQFGLSLPTIVTLANVTTLFCQVVIMYRLRGQARMRAVWTMLLGMAVTIPAGIWLLTMYGKQTWLVRVFGLFVTTVAVWLLAAPRRPVVTERPRRVLGLVAGLFAGLASGMFNTGGPPVVLYTYTRPMPLNSAKATVQWIFTSGSLYRLTLVTLLLMMSAIGQEGRPDLTFVGFGALTIPLVMIAAAGGVALSSRVHPDRLRKAVFVLLIIFGLKMAIWP